MKSLGIPVLILAIAFGVLYSNNPFLFGQSTGESLASYNTMIAKAVPELDDELFGLAEAIGADFKGYRNHCLRVVALTKYYLPDWVLVEIPDALELAATAIAYHDVALWTDGALDYLDPSAAQMEKILADKHPVEEIQIMKEIILQHHKITEYTSDNNRAVAALVNAVRKADWADFTMGVVRFGAPSSLIEAAYTRIPDAGFHDCLMGMGQRLSPDNFLGQFDTIKIFKW